MATVHPSGRRQRVAAELAQRGCAIAESGIDAAALERALAAFLGEMTGRRNEPDAAEAAAWLRYPVPRLGEGDTCSIHGELEEEPFDLRPHLGLEGVSDEALAEHPEIARLRALRAVVAGLASATASDWAGIYARRDTPQGPALVKLAYVGRPSRAIFPLTAEFGARSNNTKAALSGRAILVADVADHIAAGNAYYECDPEVRSELCLPIMSGNEAAGLIDLESFTPRHYDATRCGIAAMASLYLLDRDLV